MRAAQLIEGPGGGSGGNVHGWGMAAPLPAHRFQNSQALTVREILARAPPPWHACLPAASQLSSPQYIDTRQPFKLPDFGRITSKTAKTAEHRGSHPARPAARRRDGGARR